MAGMPPSVFINQVGRFLQQCNMAHVRLALDKCEFIVLVWWC